MHESIALAEPVAISDYELERGKPMPSRNHSLIQIRLSYLLTKHFDELFSFLSEADLASSPKAPRLTCAFTPRCTLIFRKKM